MHDTMSPPVSVFGVFTKGERDFMFMGIDKQGYKIGYKIIKAGV